MKKWITESSKEVYSHPHLSIVEETVKILPGEIIGERFITIRGKNVALILPLKKKDGERYFGLVYQYRHSWKTHSWEIPAGLIEENEDVIDAALRELKEEAGLKCKKENLRNLVRFRPNAISQALYTVFEAQDCVEGENNPEDTEDLVFQWVSERKVVEMLRNGEILHAPTILSLLWVILGYN